MALVASAPAAAGVVEPSSVSRSVNLSAGATRSLTLTCPRESVALNGAATALPAWESLPRANPRRWTFRFTAGSSAAEAGAVLRCVHLGLPRGIRGVGLVVGTRWSQRLNVLAGTARRVELRCSPGQLPTGWGIERSEAPAAASLGIAEVVPKGRSFIFKLENTGAVDASAALHIRCLERTQSAGKQSKKHSFATRIATFHANGVAAQRHSCERSEFSVSTGVSLDPTDDILLAGAYPAGKRVGRWSFRGSAANASVITKLVCLSRTTRFR